ncbi:YciI family protein [Sulfitobacter sp. LCG007]
MLVALVAKDKPGSLGVRQENRPAHLDYLKASAGTVHMAGPLIGDDGAMIGSLVVLDVADMAAAEDWAAADPYARAGLFDEVTLTEWKKVIG